jgi:ArsR family transcriptional regulator
MKEEQKDIDLKKNLCKSCYFFFSTLSNPTRLAILEQLRVGPKNVTQISNKLKQDQSMISHNLRSLVNCGFILIEKNWKEHIYSINSEIVEAIFQILNLHTNNFCKSIPKCKKIKIENQ